MSTLAASGVSGSNTARKDPSATTNTTKKGGYTQLNLQPYKRQDAKQYNKSGHGMQSLGKVVATSRRMPNPASLPSLRSEHAGNDPLVALVPMGGSGWKNSREEKENNDENVSTDEPLAKDQEVVVTKSNRERSPPPRSPGKKFKTDFPSLEEQESMTKKELEELHRRQREEGLGVGGERHSMDNKLNERSWRDHDVGPHGLHGPPPTGPYNRGAPFPPAPYPPYMMQPPPHRHGVHHYPGGPPMHAPGGTRGGHFPHPPMHFRPPFPPHNYPPVNPYEMPDLPRPPTVKADELKSMDMGDEEEGGWAGHHEEVDYTKEVVFSDSSDDETPPLPPPITADDNKGRRKKNEPVPSNKKIEREEPSSDKDPQAMRRLPSDHRRERHRGTDERKTDPPQHGAVPPYSYPPYSYPQYGYHHPMYGPPQGPYPVPPHGGYPPNQRLIGGHSRGGRRGGYGDRDEYHQHWGGHDSRQHRGNRKRASEDDRPRIMSKHEEKRPSKVEESASSPVDAPTAKTTTSVSPEVPEVPHGHHVTFADETQEPDSPLSTSDNSSCTAASVSAAHMPPTRRSQQPKIMLRKMVDKDSDVSSDKTECGGKERPRDLKSLKTAEDEDPGDGRGKPTAWSMKERGPIVSPKTLYEPEGKQSAAKFKKYQAQAREQKSGKTAVDGAESASAGDVKETASPTESKSSRSFSPSTDKKPDQQRKGQQPRRVEGAGRDRHHPERQVSGHDRPRHRKEDSQRDGEFSDDRAHVDSKSIEETSHQNYEAIHRISESSQHGSEPNHEQLEPELAGLEPAVDERNGGDQRKKREFKGRPRSREDKLTPHDKTNDDTPETEVPVSTVHPEHSSGRQWNKHYNVKPSEKTRWHDHKTHDVRPDTEKSRQQSDRKTAPQRRDDRSGGKHQPREDSGRSRGKYQGGKDEQRTDPRRRQEKSDRSHPAHRRDEGWKETSPPSSRPSTELTHEPRAAYGYTEVYDIDSGSDWDDEHSTNLEQMTSPHIKPDTHPPHEPRGNRKPVRGRDDHRPARDDRRPARDDRRPAKDDRRPARDDRRPARDDRRPARDDRRPLRDDRRPPRDDRRPTRDDHRPTRDDHRPPRDDRRPVREDRRPVRDDHRSARDDRRPPRDDHRPARKERSHKDDRRGRADGRGSSRGKSGKWEESQEKIQQQTDSSSKEELGRGVENDTTEHESQGSTEKLESGPPKTDITKYDLSSIRIAIVDDIGEHEHEEGRQSPSGFVEVTSKKTHKEKLRKEKEEQRKLAEDRKKEDKRRRQGSSKPPLGSEKAPPSANKPFTAWNATSGEADFNWSSDHDLHTVLPTMSAAPGSHLKSNVPGISQEIGFIGDSLPQSKANVPHTAELVSSTSTASIPVDVSDKSYTLFDGHGIVDTLFSSSRMLEAAVESTVPSSVSAVPLTPESSTNVSAAETAENIEITQSTQTKVSSNNELPSRGRGNSKNLPPRLKNGGPGKGRGGGEERREKRNRVGVTREAPHRTNPSHRGDTQTGKPSQQSSQQTSQQSSQQTLSSERRFYVHPRAREPGTRGQRSSGEKSVHPGESKVAGASSKMETHDTDSSTDAMATGQLLTSRAGSGLVGGDELGVESEDHTPPPEPAHVRPTSASSSIHSNSEVKGQSSKDSNGGRNKSTVVTKSVSYAQAVKTSFSKSDVSTSCSKVSSRSQTPSESSSMLQDLDDSRSSTPASEKPPSSTQWEGSNVEYESGRASQASCKSAVSAHDGSEIVFMSTSNEQQVEEKHSDECSMNQTEEQATILHRTEPFNKDGETVESKSHVNDDRESEEPTAEQIENTPTQATPPVQDLPAMVSIESETSIVTDNEATPLFKPQTTVSLNEAHLSTDAHSKQTVAQPLLHVKPPQPSYLIQSTKSAVSSHSRSVPVSRGTPHSVKPSHHSPAYVSTYKQFQQPLLRLPHQQQQQQQQQQPPLIQQPPLTQHQLLTLLKHAAVIQQHQQQQQQNHHFLLQQQAMAAAAQGKIHRVDKFNGSNPSSVIRTSPDSPHGRAGVSGLVPVHQGQLKHQPLSHGGGPGKNTSAFSPYMKQPIATHPILSHHHPTSHYPSDQSHVKKSAEQMGGHDLQEQMSDATKSRLSIKAIPFIPTSQPASSSSGPTHNSPPSMSQVSDVGPPPAHAALQVSRPPGFEHTAHSSPHLLYQHHHPNLQVRPLTFPPTVTSVVRPHPLPIPTQHAMQQHMTMLAATHHPAPRTSQQKSSLTQGVPLPDSHAFQVITPQTEQNKPLPLAVARRQLAGEAGLVPSLKDSHTRKPIQSHLSEQLQVNAIPPNMELQARSMAILGGAYAIRNQLPPNQANILKLTTSTNVVGKRALLPTPTGAALLPHAPPVTPPTVQSWAGTMRVPRITTAPSAAVSFPQEQAHRTSSLYNTGYGAGQY